MFEGSSFQVSAPVRFGRRSLADGFAGIIRFVPFAMRTANLADADELGRIEKSVTCDEFAREGRHRRHARTRCGGFRRDVEMICKREIFD